MQTSPLSGLPTELIREITKLVPTNQTKSLRLINTTFNATLRNYILSSIVIYIHHDALDLSLVEALAADQAGVKPIGICRIVKRLHVKCLNPLENFRQNKFKRRARASVVDITVCVNRLAGLLGQALYGLRYINEIHWNYSLPTVGIRSIVTRWLSTQLQNARIIRVTEPNLKRPSVIEYLSTPSLGAAATLTTLTFSIPWEGLSPRLRHRLRSIIFSAPLLRDLEICGVSLSDIMSLLRRDDSNSTSTSTPFPPLSRLGILQLSKGSFDTEVLQALTATLTHFQHMISSKPTKYSGSGSNDSLYLEPYPSCSYSLWKTVKDPQVLCNVTNLTTNSLCAKLFKHLMDSFPKLAVLVLSVPGGNLRTHYRYDPLDMLSKMFYDEVVPTLSGRLRDLTIQFGPKKSLWCLHGNSVERMKEMVERLVCLEFLQVQVEVPVSVSVLAAPEEDEEDYDYGDDEELRDIYTESDQDNEELDLNEEEDENEDQSKNENENKNKNQNKNDVQEGPLSSYLIPFIESCRQNPSLHFVRLFIQEFEGFTIPTDCQQYLMRNGRSESTNTTKDYLAIVVQNQFGILGEYTMEKQGVGLKLSNVAQ